MDLKQIIKTSSTSIQRNSPSILTGFAVAGLLSTVVLAVKGTIKATDALYHEANFRYEEWERGTGEDRSAYPTEVFTTEEIIQLTWKFYIPTAIMGLTTTACMIGVNSIHLRRNAALASLFSVAETTLKEYQAKVVEHMGEKKEELIRGEIAQDHIEKNPPAETTIVLTGKGTSLVCDEFSKRYFRSDIEALRRAENTFNQRLIREGWLNINYLYDLVGLEDMELGDEMGWIAERELLEFKFYSKLATHDGVTEPCLVMDYRVSPHHI